MAKKKVMILNQLHPDFNHEGFITKAGQKRLREILKQFDAPLKALKAFSDGEEDGVKHELDELREHFL